MYGFYGLFPIHWFALTIHSVTACSLYLISEVFQILVYCIQSGQCCWYCQRGYWSWKSKCSFLNEWQGLLFITYLLQCVSYLIFKKNHSCANQTSFQSKKCNQPAPTLKDYYQSELYTISNNWVLRTLWLVKKLCFLILHRLTPTYVRRWLLWWMYREDKPWSLHLKPPSNLLLLHTIVFLEQTPARHLHAFSPVLLTSRAGFWRQETHRLNKQFTS